MFSVVFVAGARDYHAIDWYRIVKSAMPDKTFAIVTDLLQGEGYAKIVGDDDHVVQLFPLDKFLPKKQSHLGDQWRNVLKLAFLPILAWRLNGFARLNKHSTYHAHSMYYIFLCWAARVKCIGTPQGSDILVRPFKSRLYRMFAIISLRYANSISVDSVAMARVIYELSGVTATIVQNGVDTVGTKPFRDNATFGERVVSFRGLYENYRVCRLFESRAATVAGASIDLIYPFFESHYRTNLLKYFAIHDRDLGYVDKAVMYKLFSESLIAISIPISDSSPRSVYEAIFCGCCVAATYGVWIDYLPSCMRARVIVVDISDEHWLESAISFAKVTRVIPFQPSVEAIEIFDSVMSLTLFAKEAYR